MRIRSIYLTIISLALLSSCREVPCESTGSLPEMFPDYSGVTIPANIAPLNFRFDGECRDAILELSSGDLSFTVRGPEFDIPLKKWRALTSTGEDIVMKVSARKDGVWESYLPFTVYVSEDSIDSHIAYRLIDPGYESWGSMGIYQRCIEDFTETAVITNSSTGNNCMNCHSFAGRDPSRMVFHMRAKNGGTYVTSGSQIRKLNTKTPQTIAATVYPQWSDDGRYIAFSVNDIWQVFHSTKANRIEVYDSAADVVVYDAADDELVSTPLLMQEDVLETFPSFSPDGRTLYFCSSPRQDVPDDYEKIRYSICSIPFNPDDCSFGSIVDTLFNAGTTGRTATFPRVSPDGRWLMFASSAYGCFNIWHKDADLYVIDLHKGEIRPVEEANSDDAESYHSWSSNGRWFVFGSRRMDGLFTRPYICHFDKDGKCSKPFLLPQKKSSFYKDSFKSYNIPEFVSGPVTVSVDDIVACARDDKGTDLTFRSK